MTYSERIQQLRSTHIRLYEMLMEDIMSIVYTNGGKCPDLDSPIGQGMMIRILVDEIKLRKWGYSIHEKTGRIAAASITTGEMRGIYPNHNAWIDKITEGDGEHAADALLDVFLQVTV